MIDALYVAISGMQSEQSHINTVSNNLANLNTVGFKKSQVRFDDLVYRNVTSATSSLDLVNNPKMIGMGSSVADISKVFSAGDLKPTENPLDIAIAGKGFFEVELDNGEFAYTRNGSLEVNADGFLTSAGSILSSRIQLPPDVAQVTIQRDGVVKVRVSDDQRAFEVGQLELSYFLNEGDLESLGAGQYAATEQSGRAYYSEAERNGLGKIEQGFLEASNVDLVQELIELTVAQRGFEVNSQVIRTADQIMQIINNLSQSR